MLTFYKLGIKNDLVYALENQGITTPTPKKQMTLENISQIVVETSNRKKLPALLKILQQDYPSKAIIFCKTRVRTNTLYEELLNAGYSVAALHGDLTQAKREFVMKSFRNNEVKFLIATDVAARGLDVVRIYYKITILIGGLQCVDLYLKLTYIVV